MQGMPEIAEAQALMKHVGPLREAYSALKRN
jgi:hypothetical protein